MKILPSKFYRMLTDVILGLIRFCAGRELIYPSLTLKTMSQDIHEIERHLDKAIHQLDYWRSEREKLLPFKDRRIEWGVTANDGAIRCFYHKLSNRIDELFPSQNLYAMISTNNELSTKIEEYEITLQFFQEYLQLERENLKRAQEKSLPHDILEFLKSRVEKLESNVDRYQSWISTFKSQLKINEA